MIRASRSSILMLASSTAALGAVVGFVVYPTLRKADERATEAGRLLGRAAQLSAATRERDEMRDRVEASRAASREVLRSIPTTTDQAALMRMLAVETGGDVQTQVINAGEAVPATPVASSPYKAVPVSVEMTATFPEIMNLLARAEGGERLVRAIKVTIEKPPKRDNRRDADWESPFVKANIDFDAVFGAATDTASGVTP